MTPSFVKRTKKNKMEYQQIIDTGVGQNWFLVVWDSIEPLAKVVEAVKSYSDYKEIRAKLVGDKPRVYVKFAQQKKNPGALTSYGKWKWHRHVNGRETLALHVGAWLRLGAGEKLEFEELATPRIRGAAITSARIKELETKVERLLLRRRAYKARIAQLEAEVEKLLDQKKPRAVCADIISDSENM